jgi:hypothetical protein
MTTIDRSAHDDASRLAASIGSPRNVESRTLTVDATIRHIILSGTYSGPRAYRLYGSSVQAYYTTRSAENSATADTPVGLTDVPVLSGSLAAPTTDGAGGTQKLTAPAAGSAGTAASLLLSDNVAGGAPLPTDTTAYETIHVRERRALVLYMYAASATTVVMVGPFE